MLYHLGHGPALVRNSTLAFIHSPHMVVDQMAGLGPKLSDMLLGSTYGLTWSVVS